MAGMEQIEIHSKSYLVRWIKVAADHTISWSLQPQKKSINFGVFKHPGNANGATPSLPTMPATLQHTNSDGPEADSHPGNVPPAHSSTTRRKSPSTSTVTDKLQKLGMKRVAWTGRCEAERVSLGHYDVPAGESGMYGLVFDNTHSKQFSKTVTVVIMTYPTNAPPKSGHHLRLMPPHKGSSRTSPALLPVSDSNEDLPQEIGQSKTMLTDSRPRTDRAAEYSMLSGLSFYSGVLSKKRRKRNQGYARRFFSLDFTTSTLSYYKNRNTSALRGAVPLSLAVIGANENSRHISIDSGAEIWLLRAHNQKDFEGWKEALEKASQIATGTMTPAAGPGSRRSWARTNPTEDQWGAVENLVGRVAGITDAMRRLAKDAEPKYSSAMAGLGIKDASGNNSTTISPIDHEGGDYFQTDDTTSAKRAFWKRSLSNGGQSPSGMFRRSFSTHKTTNPALALPSPTNATFNTGRKPVHTPIQPQDEQVHERCMAVLRDLDGVVAQFSSLIAESRQHRLPEHVVTARNSLDSSWSQEFFDADDGTAAQILDIDRDSEAETSPERDGASEAGDTESTSDIDGDDRFSRGRTPQPRQPAFFPSAAKSLTPLPKPPIYRRTIIAASSAQPPSLISFLRKNVGKDLSTVAMPVTSNEPLSLLQRQAESLEYSHLLDAAAALAPKSPDRLLHVTAFAISALSAARARERATRKPFNPLLGETFELVREDRAFRFLAEKISHRPVRLACQAEAAGWTFTHAPSPSQKFWGKSAELVTEGRARVVLHGDRGGAGDECFSWTPPTCFLRNVLAGEKYVEPVQSMTVVEEEEEEDGAPGGEGGGGGGGRGGRKAVATFRAGGMFSGRSEEVEVRVYDARGQLLPMGLVGKWTSHLDLFEDGGGGGGGGGAARRRIWEVGSLVHNAGARYGFTTFAAGLNEVTAMEEVQGVCVLPPTDSRLRPDQRAYEEGMVERAEGLKGGLEEGQRRRRREMEGSGRVWEPRWFERVGKEGGDGWVLKGARGYWDVRERVVGGSGVWEGVGRIFEVE